LDEFCNEFPRKVGDLSVVIVKKKVSDAAPTHADFKVNREKVENWLKWLKENHRSYRNITTPFFSHFWLISACRSNQCKYGTKDSFQSIQLK